MCSTKSKFALVFQTEKVNFVICKNASRAIKSFSNKYLCEIHFQIAPIYFRIDVSLLQFNLNATDTTEDEFSLSNFDNLTIEECHSKSGSKYKLQWFFFALQYFGHFKGQKLKAYFWG